MNSASVQTEPKGQSIRYSGLHYGDFWDALAYPWAQTCCFARHFSVYCFHRKTGDLDVEWLLGFKCDVSKGDIGDVNKIITSVDV